MGPAEVCSRAADFTRWRLATAVIIPLDKLSEAKMDHSHRPAPNDPPNRPLMRLERHHFAASARNRAPYTRELEKLVSEFAWWNEMATAKQGFDLTALASPSVPPSDIAPANGFDHVWCFRRHRRPVAMLTEPYEPETHLDGIRARAESLGLLVHTPPNLYASFAFPGWTGCILITRPDFGRVLWLEDQLEFHGHGLVT